MTKVTYLLGAGASANTIPTVNAILTKEGEIPGLTDAILNYASSLEKLIETNANNDETKLFLQDCRSFATDLNDVGFKAREYGSIDTYAKKLYLQGESPELASLKRTLSVYLAVLQQEKDVHFRYNGFLAKILQRKNAQVFIPPNVKILSWNYDLQLEFALRKFLSKEKSLWGMDRVFEHTKCAPLYQGESPSIIHLNGICGCYYNSNDCSFEHGHDQSYLQNGRNWTLQAIYDYYNDNNKNTARASKALTFAWEDPLELTSKAIDTVKGTSCLIVIGYSFPFLNRDVDAELFKALKPTLKKIYFQDPILDGSFLQEQFNLSNSIEIAHKKDTHQFHVPNEL
jgi:hypothetical protein